MKRLSFCIGINKYPKKVENLKGCVNDANDWHNLLTDKFNFQAINSGPLLNSAATKTKILEGLQVMLERLNVGDLGVFFFSGHGLSIYLDMPDDDYYDEAIYTADEKSIVDDDLRKLLNTYKTKAKLIFIFDNLMHQCCSSVIVQSLNQWAVAIHKA